MSESSVRGECRGANMKEVDMGIPTIRLLATIGVVIGGFLAVTGFMAGWTTYGLALSFATAGCLVVAVFAQNLFPSRAKRDNDNNN